MAYLTIREVSKSYDGVTTAVDGISIDIEKGEFVTFLGPSGSGKTTTLVMVAGFEEPTSGGILLAGQGSHPPQALGAEHRHGVPELRAVPAYDGGTQYRLPAPNARR